MRGVNKAIIVGTLGDDPTLNNHNGTQFATLSVATNESWKDKQTGEQKERTEWHRVSLSGRLAEIAGEYLHKGSQVYVEGPLQTRKWQDKEGNDRYTTEIKGFNLQMLGSKGDKQKQSQPKPKQEESAPFDDDIPF